jgi:hypothetical protein
VTDLIRCARCEASAILGDHGALSRVTRDHKGAPVIVCNRCGERESLYGREPQDQIQLADWPVSIEQILVEEEILLRRVREGEIRWLSADEIA